MKTKFVLSSKGFKNITDAERVTTGMLNANTLRQGTMLYRVVKVYKPVIKFKEVK